MYLGPVHGTFRAIDAEIFNNNKAGIVQWLFVIEPARSIFTIFAGQKAEP